LAITHYGALDPKLTKAVAVDALKDPVFSVRIAAINVLISLRDKLYTEALYNELTNPNHDFERAIMPVLSKLSDSEAVGLAHKAVHDEKVGNKNAIIDAFKKAPTKRMLAFFKPLITDKDVSLAEGAANVVLTLRRKDALPLLEALVKKGDPAVQTRVLEALSKYPKGTNLKFVKKLLKSKDPVLQMGAAEVLAHHGNRSGIKVLLPKLTSKVDADVIRALDALVKVPGKDLLAPLRPFMVKTGISPEIMRRAMDIHYKAGDPKFKQHLMRFRRDDRIKVQAAAVYYLGLVDKGRALPSLHEDLFHGDAFVRKAAIQAVSSIGSRESIPHLKRALDNLRDGSLRAMVVEALAGIKDRDVVPIVSFLITDPHPDVRRWAIIALTRAGHKDAVSSLKIALTDASIEARYEAIRAIIQLDKTEGIANFRMALGWLPPEKLTELAKEIGDGFVPYLNIALTSSRPEVQKAAMTALESAGAEKETSLLTGALGRTRDAALKVSIMNRLAALHGSKELTRLQKASGGGQPMQVRLAAVRLMGEIGDAAADVALRTSLLDSDEKIRTTAAVAMLELHGAFKGKAPRKKRKKKKK
jgi:HEAT repeat protein